MGWLRIGMHQPYENGGHDYPPQKRQLSRFTIIIPKGGNQNGTDSIIPRVR
jgi:putative component of membrane protein insertase Oxa1/YidC/SpoIIIJ protein YidD